MYEISNGGFVWWLACEYNKAAGQGNRTEQTKLGIERHFRPLSAPLISVVFLSENSIMKPASGQLYIVATPIGNLGDMSPRAVQTLKEVDRILAEDTRHGRKLCTHFGVDTPMQAYHDHNETQQTPKLIEELQAGHRFALISDAGTPLVSDPGYKLVDAAQTAGVEVIAIPGPSAIIAALSVAGLPTDRFYFEGFLPAKQQAKEAVLLELGNMSCTTVAYESKHRILATLQSTAGVLGADREIVLARELSKRFETVIRGPVATVLAKLNSQPEQQKGEFVLLIRGSDTSQSSLEVDQILQPLLKVLPTKQAVKTAQEISGLNKNTLYQRALELGRQG